MNAAERVPVMLASVSEPSRLRVVTALVEGDFCVTEVAERVGLSQSCTTRHLQVLQRAGVVTRSRAGKRVLFRLREDDAELIRILELLALRQPLRAHDAPRRAEPRPARPPARPAASRATRSTRVAGDERADAVTIHTTAHAASDREAAADSPSGAVHDASLAASPTGGDTELEDYLL